MLSLVRPGFAGSALCPWEYIASKLFATATLASTGLVGPAAISAQADTQDCVTRQEYKRLKGVSSISLVHHVFDTMGKSLYGSSGNGFTREYVKGQ